MKYLALILLAVSLTANASGHCDYDRAKMLSLDMKSFDQDRDGGWRKLAQAEGCAGEAADLIRDYRQANGVDAGILYWHEGQLRAELGQNKRAVALLEKARKPAKLDKAGWNYYVDATIAFLKQDKAGLLKSRALLAGVKKPDELNIVDADGKPVEIPWPPNLKIVDSFVRCFDKSYAEAYGNCH